MNKAFFTQTMAKLYEKQEKFWEAYIIYKKLYSQNPKTEFKEKIEQLGNMLIDESLYSQITLKIFDKAELARLSVFPDEQYKILTKINSDMTKSDDFNKIIDSYDQNNETDEDIKHYSGEEIYEIIQTNFGGKKPNEIKLADIYEIIKRK